MQQEARESALYLGEEVEGVLGDNVEGAGQDSGHALRQKLTEQVECTRGKVLLRALELHQDREARPVSHRLCGVSQAGTSSLPPGFWLCPAPDLPYLMLSSQRLLLLC